VCQLELLDISKNPKLSQDISGDGCACHLLASWIADKNIKLQAGYRLNCTSKVLGKIFLRKFDEVICTSLMIQELFML
jgi:hypothetical protein